MQLGGHIATWFPCCFVNSLSARNKYMSLIFPSLYYTVTELYSFSHIVMGEKVLVALYVVFFL